MQAMGPETQSTQVVVHSPQLYVLRLGVVMDKGGVVAPAWGLVGVAADIGAGCNPHAAVHVRQNADKQHHRIFFL